MLAVISPSRDASVAVRHGRAGQRGRPADRRARAAVPDDASALAASRRGNAPAMALLLAVSAWASDAIGEDTARTAEILAAAGWRVAIVTASTPLAAAWQQLHRPADRPLPVGGYRRLEP